MSKIRNGFVSNSSSSSFIIKANKTEDDTIKIPLKNFGEVIKDEQSLKKHFENSYFWGSMSWENMNDEDGPWGEYEVKKYNEYLEIINSGQVIIKGSAEYEAVETFQTMFIGLDVEWDD